ncbi:MAG: P-loop NTPase [Spirochaetaceae bacterium]
MIVERKGERPLRGKKIGFFGKGGAGKSTSLVLVAHALRQHGYVVTVLDADSTNYGLNEALGVPVPPAPLMEFFGGAVFRGGKVSCPVDDPGRIADARLHWQDIPEQYRAAAPSGIRYLVAGKIANQGPGAGCDGPVAKIARDLIVEEEGEPGVMLLDFKAGFEDSARGVVTGIDWGVVVIDPTTASVQMALDLNSMLEALRQGVPPATEHLESEEDVHLMREIFRNASIEGLSYLLNRVDTAETEQYLRETLQEHGITPDATLYADTVISTAWLRGEPIGYTGESNQEAATLVEKLEAAFNLERTT